jgi:hypothetical protein
MLLMTAAGYAYINNGGDFSMAEDNPSLAVSVRISISADTLRLLIEIRNNDRRPAYIFNILHNEIGNSGYYELDEHQVYSEIMSGVLYLSQKMFPVPTGFFVERQNIPFVTIVDADASYVEEIHIRLPIHLHNPYKDARVDGVVRPITCRSVFQIGYFFGVAATRNFVKEFPVGAGNRVGFDVFPQGSQQIISVDLTEMLPVLA